MGGGHRLCDALDEIQIYGAHRAPVCGCTFQENVNFHEVLNGISEDAAFPYLKSHLRGGPWEEKRPRVQLGHECVAMYVGACKGHMQFHGTVPELETQPTLLQRPELMFGLPPVPT